MKRQIEDSGVETRVWSYGSVPGRVAPVRNEDRSIQQMKLGRRLWNVLVAIERAREARYIRIMADEVTAQIVELKGKIDAAREEIKARRKKERKRTVDLGDLKTWIGEWRVERAALIEQQKATSKERHEARRAELNKLSEVTTARIKKARQAAASMGLFWGSYNDIVQRADAGRKLGKLQFRGFRGNGTVTAQLQGGLPCTEAVAGGNGSFAIGGTVGSGRGYRYAKVRIGSQEDRGPVWLQVPIVYHRDLPEKGVIKSVSATRRVVANKERWQVNVTCTVPKAPFKESGPTIAVDIGWRLVKDGVRVAYWVDDEGKSGEVVVSIRDIDQFRRCESLTSICDKRRDEFLPGFAKWVNEVLARELSTRDSKWVSEGAMPARRPDSRDVEVSEAMPARGPDTRDIDLAMPALRPDSSDEIAAKNAMPARRPDSRDVEQSWKEKAAFLSQWRSNDRLAQLIRWWGDHRIEGDEGWWYGAQEFRKKYMHLNAWNRNLKEQMTLRLREQYRVWACGVAKKYAVCVIESFDLREVAEKPEPEGERHQKGPASYRQIVSPSTLRGALHNACGREGVRVMALPAEYTTSSCWKCGKKCTWEQGEEIWHKCEHCTARWDQDENAARNLLKEYLRAAEQVEAVAV